MSETPAVERIIRRVDAIPSWVAWLLGGLPALLATWALLRLGDETRWVGVLLVAAAAAAVSLRLGARVRLARTGLPAHRAVAVPSLRIDIGNLDEWENADDQDDGIADEPALPSLGPLDMVPIPGGSFWMGSDPRTDPDAGDDEQPRHRVSVSPFLMARTPVTRGQWRKVMAQTDVGEWHRPAPDVWGAGDDDLPATDVSWYEAVAFCNALSAMSGRCPFYRQRGEDWLPDSDPEAVRGYRLPTEAEWEFACRAGTESRWFWGDDPRGADAYAWYSGNSGFQLQPVGAKPANGFGLHDMAGNCYEWCWDWYDRYKPGAVTDPAGPAEGRQRVLRGGAFGGEPQDLRSADRFWFGPEGRDAGVGFRCVRSGAPGSTT
jgi:sulfatase modifying factor 1